MQRQKGGRSSRPPKRERLRRLLHDVRQPLTAQRLDISTALQLLRERSTDEATRALQDALGELARIETCLVRLGAEVDDVAK
jgi:hypothetical protein